MHPTLRNELAKFGASRKPMKQEVIERVQSPSFWEETAALVVLVLAGLTGLRFLDLKDSIIPAILLSTATGLGADHLYRTHTIYRPPRAFLEATSVAILPFLLVLGAAFFLRFPIFSYSLAFLVALLAVGGLLSITIVSQRYAHSPATSPLRMPSLALGLVSYLVTFGLYSAIYEAKSNSILLAVGVFVISWLIALDLLYHTERQLGRSALSSLVVAVVLGETAWALDYWVINGLVAGVFLLLVFYVLVGLFQHHLVNSLSRRVVIEFVVVGLIGFGFVVVSTFWLPRF